APCPNRTPAPPVTKRVATAQAAQTCQMAKIRASDAKKNTRAGAARLFSLKKTHRPIRQNDAGLFPGLINDHLVNNTVRARLVGGHVVVAVTVFGDLLHALPRVAGE